MKIAVRTIALLVVLAAFGSALAQFQANPTQAAKGAFYLSPVNGTPITVPTPEAGATIRLAWSSIDNCSTYTWTALNNWLTSLGGQGKLANIDILTGIWSPSCRLSNYEADGVGTFVSTSTITPNPTITQQTTNYPNASAVTMRPCSVAEKPIPYDPTYQTDITNLIGSLETDLASQTYKNSVVRIFVNGISDTTGDEEILYLRTTNSAITCTSGYYTSYSSTGGGCASNTAGATCNLCTQGQTTCTPSLDYQEWINDNYTPNTLASAAVTFAGIYAADFPNVALVTTYATGQLPPVNNSGQYTGQANDNTLKYTLMPGFLGAGSYQIIANNAAQDPYTATFAYPYAHWSGVGTQQVTTVQNNPTLTYEANYAVQADGSYIEFYPTESGTAANAPVITWANDALQHAKYHQGFSG